MSLEMASQEPSANAMNIEAAGPRQMTEQQDQVKRLRGGGNTCIDCLAYLSFIIALLMSSAILCCFAIEDILACCCCVDCLCCCCNCTPRVDQEY